MSYALNPELLGALIQFDSTEVHEAMAFDGNTVRQWRSRGFFRGGKRSGRGYLYTAEDIAHLMILREMNDVGVQMITATTAAELGAPTLIAHCLANAPLIQLVAPVNKIQEITDFVLTDAFALPQVFGTDMDTLHYPNQYLVTGGDDFDDWWLIDSLEQLAENADYNLATIILDLGKMSDRMIATMNKMKRPLASFDIPKERTSTGEVSIRRVSTDPEASPVQVN
jgi:hypothetical protein